LDTPLDHAAASVQAEIVTLEARLQKLHAALESITEANEALSEEVASSNGKPKKSKSKVGRPKSSAKKTGKAKPGERVFNIQNTKTPKGWYATDVLPANLPDTALAVLALAGSGTNVSKKQLEAAARQIKPTGSATLGNALSTAMKVVIEAGHAKKVPGEGREAVFTITKNGEKAWAKIVAEAEAEEASEDEEEAGEDADEDASAGVSLGKVSLGKIDDFVLLAFHKSGKPLATIEVVTAVSSLQPPVEGTELGVELKASLDRLEKNGLLEKAGTKSVRGKTRQTSKLSAKGVKEAKRVAKKAA